MRQTTHTTQVYTLFGGGYVHEAHGRGPALGQESKYSRGKWVLLLIALVFGATTAAGAITATSRSRTAAQDLWKQNPPSILTKLPGSFGFEESLY
jgi:hypothetical protein